MIVMIVQMREAAMTLKKCRERRREEDADIHDVGMECHILQIIGTKWN